MQEQLKEVRLNSEARVSLVHKQMCYLQKGPLDVLRKWMRTANPVNIPIDDVEDYFRVVFNEFLSHRKIEFWRRFLSLTQKTVQGLQLSPQELTIWTRQWLPQTYSCSHKHSRLVISFIYGFHVCDFCCALTTKSS